MKSASKIIAALSLFLVLAPFAHAERLQFVTPIQSATATTTLTYVPAGGNATTTAFDSFATGQIAAVDQGVFLFQNIASSSSAVVTLTDQYSQDGIDWYNDDLITVSTTTSPYSINTPVSYALTGNTNRTSVAVKVNFPTRFEREIISVTGANDGFWWQFIPQRQSDN